jgi:hypothetical protein
VRRLAEHVNRLVEGGVARAVCIAVDDAHTLRRGVARELESLADLVDVSGFALVLVTRRPPEGPTLLLRPAVLFPVEPLTEAQLLCVTSRLLSESLPSAPVAFAKPFLAVLYQLVAGSIHVSVRRLLAIALCQFDVYLRLIEEA